MARQRLTGILLVGGASRRFGGPKAFARVDGETLAERAWRLLGEICEERLAVGKRADALALPFAVHEDGLELRAPIVGLVGGLRAAGNDVCVVVPVDMPALTAEALRRLADSCADAAVPPSGPLPGAYRKTSLPVLERRLAAGELALRDALTELTTVVVEIDAEQLVNVNTPRELRSLR